MSPAMDLQGAVDRVDFLTRAAERSDLAAIERVRSLLLEADACPWWVKAALEAAGSDLARLRELSRVFMLATDTASSDD